MSKAGLEALLLEWCTAETDAVGTYEGHFPIDATTHGNRTTECEAWGCSSCGIGWPCLVIRTVRTLGGDPTYA